MQKYVCNLIICYLILNDLQRYKIYRCEQGSNLRGKIPLDFKSNALTTRPSQLLKSPYLKGFHELLSFYGCKIVEKQQVKYEA